MNRRSLIKALAGAAVTLLAAPLAAVGKLTPAAAAPVKFRTIQIWAEMKITYDTAERKGLVTGYFWRWMEIPFEKLEMGNVFRFTDEIADGEAKKGMGRTEYTVEGNPKPLGTDGNWSVQCSKIVNDFKREQSSGLAT